MVNKINLGSLPNEKPSNFIHKKNPILTKAMQEDKCILNKPREKKLLKNIDMPNNESDATQQIVLKMRIEEGKKIAIKKLTLPGLQLTPSEQKSLDLYIDHLVKELKKLEQFRTQAPKVFNNNIIPKKLPRI